MADIAPLGFAVDTKPLDDAAKAAAAAKTELLGIADAQDKIGETAKQVEKAAEATKKHAEAVKEQTKAGGDAAANAQAASEKSLAASKEELATRQRIHEMVERSLNKMQQGYAQPDVLTLTSAIRPRNPGAEAFQSSIGASAARNMAPTENEIRLAEERRKAMEKQRKEIENLMALADPAAAKIAKLERAIESLGRAYDSGQISPDEYNQRVGQLGNRIDQLEQGPGPNSMHRHHSFGMEAFRQLTYSFPHLGREARSIYGAAASGQFSTGGLLTLGAGAAVGSLGMEAIFKLAELPKIFAEAEDQAERLKQRIDAFGTAGGGEAGLERIRGTAEQLGVGLRDAAAAMQEFENSFNRFNGSTATKDQLFAAAGMAGRIGGLDQSQIMQSTQAFAGLVDKQVLSGGDIAGLRQSNPVLYAQLAKQFGGDDQFRAMAATGQISGEALASAALKSLDTIRQLNQQIPEKSDELQQRTKDAWEKLSEKFGGGLEDFFHRAGLKVAEGLLHLGFGEERTNGVTVRLPNTAADIAGQRISDAATAGEQYGSYYTRRQQMADDLSKMNIAIQAGEKNWANLTEAQRASVATLRDERRELEAMMVEPDTPFSMLSKQVDQLREAMGQGSGGLIDVWTRALAIQDQQRRIGHGVVESLDNIVAKIKELDALQAQRDLSNKTGELSIAQRMLATATGAEGDIDSLKLQATQEGLTYAFQKFGDQVDENDDFVKRYIDTLYRLKLAQRDLTDETEARTVTAGARDKERVLSLIMSGATPAQIAAAQAENQLGAFARSRMAQGAAAVPGSTTTVPGGGSYYSGAAAGGTASLQDVIATIRFLESGGYGDYKNGRPLRSDQGALYAMQVLPSTAARPGHGIVPARNQSAFEYDRVGSDLVTALFSEYGGDVSKVLGAYHSGPGALGHLGPKGRDYVAKGLARLGLSGTAPGNVTVTTEGLPEIKPGMSAAGMDLYNAKLLDMQVDARIAAAQRSAQDRNRGLTAIGAAQVGPGQVIDTGMISALAANDRLRVHAAELELKVLQARASAPDDMKQEAEDAVRTADAMEKQRRLAEMMGRDKAREELMKHEGEMLHYFGDELRVQEALYKRRNELIEAGIDPMSQAGQIELQTAEQLERQNIALDDIMGKAKGVRDAFQFAADTIGAGWAKMFAGMERDGHAHTKDLLRGIEDAFYGMLDRIEQALVISPLMKLFDQLLNGIGNSLFPGLFGPSNSQLAGISPFSSPGTLDGSALGNVFGSSGIVPFATGDILNTPTRFMFGGGRRVGLGGEAGYEALMPLRRGPDGRLGVAAQGGGGGDSVQVNVFDQRGADAAPVEIQERRSGDGTRQIDVMLRDSMKGKIQSGQFDADNRAAYGLQRGPVRR
jgi:hypothetical protein